MRAPGRTLRAAAGLLLAGLAAGPPAAALAPKTLVIRDATAGDPALGPCDVLEIRATPADGGIAVEVDLAAPPDPRLFTCVHLRIDADRNQKTGMYGDEIWFRAAVGARFGGVAAGKPLPARMAWSSLGTRETLARGRKEAIWLNHYLDAVPAVEGRTIRFAVPRKVLEAAAAKAGEEAAAKPAEEVDLSFHLETWTGDRPLLVEYAGADEGLPIAVDGDDGDWSGEPEALDEGEELFAPLARLDLRRLRVDHGPQALFVCVDTDRPGFGDLPPPMRDLRANESVTLLAEPLESDYERPHRLVVPQGRPRGMEKEGSWAVKGRRIEARQPRAGLDGRVRVLAWSEGRLVDWIPDGGYARFATGAK